jgi:hypothetical protein
MTNARLTDDQINLNRAVNTMMGSLKEAHIARMAMMMMLAGAIIFTRGNESSVVGIGIVVIGFVFQLIAIFGNIKGHFNGRLPVENAPDDGPPTAT